MIYNSYDSYDTTAQADTSWGEIASPGGAESGALSGVKSEAAGGGGVPYLATRGWLKAVDNAFDASLGVPSTSF